MIAHNPKAQVQYVVTLQGSAGAGTAHARTLKFVLKRLLRSHSLRCVDARQLDPRDDVRGRADNGDDGA
jgi:hypothetical protein